MKPDLAEIGDNFFEAAELQTSHLVNCIPSVPDP